MKKLNKVELSWFVRWSSDENKYKRYIELYDEIERLNKIIEIKTNRIQNLMSRLSKRAEKVERLNNIIENFEEELDREINIKEEDTGLEHDRYLLIKDTLETMLRRFRNIKGVDKE